MMLLCTIDDGLHYALFGKHLLLRIKATLVKDNYLYLENIAVEFCDKATVVVFNTEVGRYRCTKEMLIHPTTKPWHIAQVPAAVPLGGILMPNKNYAVGFRPASTEDFGVTPEAKELLVRLKSRAEGVPLCLCLAMKWDLLRSEKIQAFLKTDTGRVLEDLWSKTDSQDAFLSIYQSSFCVIACKDGRVFEYDASTKTVLCRVCNMIDGSTGVYGSAAEFSARELDTPGHKRVGDCSFDVFFPATPGSVSTLKSVTALFK